MEPSSLVSHRAFRGVLPMLLGLALYALSDALIKQLLGSYSVCQVTFLRALVRFFPLFFCILLLSNRKEILFTKYPKRHGIRLLVNLLYTLCFMTAFSKISLTAVYTISYTSSFFMLGWSALLLRERVAKEKWLAASCGMVGVLFAFRPDLSWDIGASLVLLGTCLGALNRIWMRKLASTEHSLTITLYPNLAMLVCLSPLCLFSWQEVSWHDWGILSLIGGITALGQYLLAEALRFSQGSLLASLDYSTLLWVVLFDFLGWGAIPDGYTLLGAFLILAANSYILYRFRAQPA